MNEVYNKKASSLFSSIPFSRINTSSCCDRPATATATELPKISANRLSYGITNGTDTTDRRGTAEWELLQFGKSYAIP